VNILQEEYSRMAKQLESKTALVTGGASGIGLAIAETFLLNGASVAIMDINSEALSKTKELCEPISKRYRMFEDDVRDRKAMHRVVEETTLLFGKIDILVTCAGVHSTIPFLDLTDEEFDRMIDIHIKGTYLAMKAVLPKMVEQRSGKIIAMASVAGKVGSAVGASHYATAKGGIIAMVKSLAREFGPYDIQINAICPGLIDTPMIAPIKEVAIDAYIKGLPLRRVGTPNDVAETALFLATDASNYITGQAINVCGGYLMM
jgi:3-oxoacyl-[acyl-carrier protein] reductase